MVDSETYSLQGDTDDGIIENNQETGVDIDGSTNTKLLAGREVSAVSGSGNGVRQQSENSRKLAGFLGNVQESERGNTTKFRAGESGWLVRSENSQSGQAGLEESVLRAVSGISLSGKDTAGRTISPETAKNFEKTVFKDKNGNLLSLYHWTTAVFDKFAKGEFGFHFGNEQQAVEKGKNLKKTGRIIKDYLDIKNPFKISTGLMTWSPIHIAFKLSVDGVITQKQYNQIKFIKKIDGTYYVVEAACENNYNKLWVQSAYLTKNKEDVTQAVIADNDQDTHAQSALVSPSSNNNIPQGENVVNTNISTKEQYDKAVDYRNSFVNKADPTGPANFMSKSEIGDGHLCCNILRQGKPCLFFVTNTPI